MVILKENKVTFNLRHFINMLRGHNAPRGYDTDLIINAWIEGNKIILMPDTRKRPENTILWELIKDIGR